jgi:NADH dehydrogenase (ubiquinone) 1 alpha/beta subcomplex 1
MFSSVLRSSSTRFASLVRPTYTFTRRTPITALSSYTIQHRFYSAQHSLSENEIVERVINVVKNFDKVDPKKVSPTSTFKTDLGLDSLDAVEVVMAMEEEFSIEIPDADADNIKSTQDAIEYVKRNPLAK